MKKIKVWIQEAKARGKGPRNGECLLLIFKNLIIFVFIHLFILIDEIVCIYHANVILKHVYIVE